MKTGIVVFAHLLALSFLLFAQSETHEPRMPQLDVGTAEQVYTVDELIEPPFMLHQPLPRYTKKATDRRIEGTVVLEGIFRKNGLLTDLKVLQSLGYGLDASAIETVSKEWRFEPARLKSTGQRVDVQARIKVSFRFAPPKAPAK
jgi:TonB family protein